MAANQVVKEKRTRLRRGKEPTVLSPWQFEQQLGWCPICPSRETIKKLRAAIKAYNEKYGRWRWVSLRSSPEVRLPFTPRQGADWYIYIEYDGERLSDFKLGEIVGFLKAVSGIDN